MAIDILGIITIGSTASTSSPSPASSSTSPAASSNTAPNSGSSSFVNAPVLQIAKDTASLSDQARDALQGKTAAPSSGQYDSNGSSVASQSAALSSVSAGQRRAIERATNAQSVTSDAVSTIGSLSRMTRAYAQAGSQNEDATVKNSFNRLFSGNATPGTFPSNNKASAAVPSEVSDETASTST